MKQYIEEVKSFLKNKAFIISYVLLVVIAFGYAMTNETISIDDLEADRYVGSGNEMLSVGRFGIWFWAFIQGHWENAYFTDIFALLLLLFAMINICIHFRRISGGKIGYDALTVFSCMILTYPMIIDIWEYTGSNGHIYGSYLLVSLILLLVRSQIYSHNWRRPWKMIPVALMMTLVCAGYESVVAIYIFFVCATLALQVVYGSEKDRKLSEVIRQALIYAAVLVAGLILRVVVHKLILAVTGIPASGGHGATQIFWKGHTFKRAFYGLIFNWAKEYFIAGLKYLPVLILVVCVMVFVVIGLVCCKKHGWVLLLPGAGMLLSLVILTIVAGTVHPYRTCQVFGVFCGFVAMLVIHVMPKKPGKKWIRTTAVVLMGCLLLHQASFINYFLELNHRRSEQEAFVVRQVGTDLARREDQEKPVIFVGDYEVDERILEAASVPEDSLNWKLFKGLVSKGYGIFDIDPETARWKRKIPENNVSSMIGWSMTAFASQESLLKLFNYYGFDYVPADWTLAEEAYNYAEETNMPAYPREGYIEDVGEYVIVHLQNIK